MPRSDERVDEKELDSNFVTKIHHDSINSKAVEANKLPHVQTQSPSDFLSPFSSRINKTRANIEYFFLTY